MQSFSQYFSIVLLSPKWVVMSLVSFLTIKICLLFSFLIILAKGLSILLVFTKNKALVSLILFIFSGHSNSVNYEILQKHWKCKSHYNKYLFSGFFFFRVNILLFQKLYNWSLFFSLFIKNKNLIYFYSFSEVNSPNH